MLWYYFRGGNDGNLLYLTPEKGFKNFGGLQYPFCLEQCACPSGKQSVIARNKSIDRNWAADVRFSGKFWFLVQFLRGYKCPFSPPADAHDELLFLCVKNIALFIDYYKWINYPTKHFWKVYHYSIFNQTKHNCFSVSLAQRWSQHGEKWNVLFQNTLPHNNFNVTIQL